MKTLLTTFLCGAAFSLAATSSQAPAQDCCRYCPPECCVECPPECCDECPPACCGRD